VILAVPALEGVKVEVHVAVPAVAPAARVQVVKVPEAVPVTLKVTVPVGATTVPAVEVSVTVAVQDDVCAVVMLVGVQLRVVLVVRKFTVTDTAALVLTL